MDNQIALKHLTKLGYVMGELAECTKYLLEYVEKGNSSVIDKETLVKTSKEALDHFREITNNEVELL